MPWGLLEPHLSRVANDDAERISLVLEKLRLYTTRLIEWNHRVSNLISANDEPRLVERHLLESLEPARWLLDSGARSWLDFGSGAGFPGLPLAMAGVGERWTLVESRRPKTLFLKKMVQDLELPNVFVIHGRLEVIADGHGRPQVDAMTSRATMRIAPTIKIAEAILKDGCYAFLWKGSGWQDELAVAQNWKKKWALEEARPLKGGPTTVLKMQLMQLSQSMS